jgi:hypothetical protein
MVAPPSRICSNQWHLVGRLFRKVAVEPNFASKPASSGEFTTAQGDSRLIEPGFRSFETAHNVYYVKLKSYRSQDMDKKTRLKVN